MSQEILPQEMHFMKMEFLGLLCLKALQWGQAVPNPFTLGESEWLVPGVTYGAKVQYVLPRSK